MGEDRKYAPVQIGKIKFKDGEYYIIELHLVNDSLLGALLCWKIYFTRITLIHWFLLLFFSVEMY